ncbi:Smg-4/UPF3 family protein [Cardiosporidium cionae]|uniref:Smg-4/UPF3 family protein n=1 Tax=Cardiosporidium cionae TaxID=476202 RepID=A0ABQ7JFP7_9APIC|nr:Smg-4/UPF3 family protein [Cardiosporidium cionae]|eukprot:KAF8822475.1 Smg-4/UPF3 family protein [Cardiosporidium cionae]
MPQTEQSGRAPRRHPQRRGNSIFPMQGSPVKHPPPSSISAPQDNKRTNLVILKKSPPAHPVRSVHLTKEHQATHKTTLVAPSVPAAAPEETSEAVQAIANTYNSKLRTKVLVRLLPPTLTEKEFLDSVGPKFQLAINWCRFVPGKRRKRQSSIERSSACYLNFISTGDAEAFIKAYHGHTFVDENHLTYRAVACIAPFQKISQKIVSDRRENTYQSDYFYIEFLKQLTEKKKRIEKNLASSNQINVVLDDKGETITPLLLSFHDRHGVSTTVSGKSYTLDDYKREFLPLEIEQLVPTLKRENGTVRSIDSPSTKRKIANKTGKRYKNRVSKGHSLLSKADLTKKEEDKVVRNSDTYGIHFSFIFELFDEKHYIS